MDLTLVGLGITTGLLIGLTGMGGAILTTPALLLLGVAPMTAIGTDLLFAALTKLVAAKQYHNHALVDWQVAKRLWMGSLPVSLVLLFWLGQQEKVNSSALSLLLAGVLFVTAIGLVFQTSIHEVGQKWRLTQVKTFKQWQASLTIIAGALLGILVTLTSVGAGALAAALMLYLYPLRLTIPRLVATDIVHAVPLLLFAGSGYWLMGYVDTMLLVNLLIGSVPAVWIATHFSVKLSHRVMRWLLSAVLIVLSFSLVWKYVYKGLSLSINVQ
jgi:uncharacterized membrane protein YfcA